MKKLFTILPCLLLLGCIASGPQKTMEDAAKALENKNPQAFLANFDLKAYTANSMTSYATELGLDSLNSLSEKFGLGNWSSELKQFDSLLNDLIGSQSHLKEDFENNVSSGEIILRCRKSETPGCPWIPTALRNAKIVEIDKNAAIAQVTTPMNLASWLALHKFGDKWLIVGQAIQESDAKKFAQAAATSAAPPPAEKPKAPKIPTAPSHEI